MDLIAPSPAQNTVHQVFAHKQMASVWETVLLATMVTSVIRHVPANVINKDVTNRVGHVSVVSRDFMAVTVS